MVDAETNTSIREQVVAIENARFIGIRVVCEISGFSKSTILRKIDEGEFPAAVIHEGNLARWDSGEILQWREHQFKKRAERLANAVAA